MSAFTNDLMATMRAAEALMRKAPPQEKIVTHPDNIALLLKQFPVVGETPEGLPPIGCSPLFGIEVTTNELMPRMHAAGKIESDDPFVEYEESDASWALRFGVARRAMVPLFVKLPRDIYQLPEVSFLR